MSLGLVAHEHSPVLRWLRLSTWTYVSIHSVDKTFWTKTWACLDLQKTIGQNCLEYKIVLRMVIYTSSTFSRSKQNLMFLRRWILMANEVDILAFASPPFCRERFLLCGTYQCVFYIHNFERLISCIRHWRRRPWLVMYCSLYSRDRKYDSCMNAIFICWNVLISCVVVSCHQQPTCNGSYKLCFSFIVVLWNILHKL